MKTTTKTITGLSLAALLALTACSDGDDVDTSNGDENGSAENNGNGEEPSGEVFEFEAPVTESQQGPYDEVTVQIPDELLESDPEYAESRVLESIAIQAGDPQEAGQCAIHATFNYAEGVEEDIRQAEVLTTALPEGAIENPSNDEEITPESELVTEPVPAEERFEAAVRDDDEGGVSGQERNFTEENITDSVIDVTCDSETVTFAFNDYEMEDWTDTGQTAYSHETQAEFEASQRINHNTFAQFEAGVDSEGNITLYAPGVDGWEYDSNGNWISN